jgi:hypothetical protein
MGAYPPVSESEQEPTLATHTCRIEALPHIW